MGLKTRSTNFVKFVVYLVAIVLINVAGITLFFRWDLTRNRVYSISEASQKVVSTLSEPLTVNVFFTKGLPAPHNHTERYLRDLLQEYAIYANQYFNYRFYDVSAQEGDMDEAAQQNQELARNYGINPVQIQVIEKDEVKFQKAFMGLVLIHGDLIEQVPTITSTDGLEYRLTTAIQKLNNKISALLRLKEKIQVKLFFSSSLKAVAPFMRLNDLPRLPERIEAIVEEVSDKTYGKLSFEYLDPSQDESLEAESKKYNILNLKWPALSGGTIPPGNGVIGLVMEYGGKVAEIPLIRVMQLPLIGKHYELVNVNDMEEIINEGIESLIDINEDLGYLASQGSLPLRSPRSGPAALQKEDALSNFHALASENYTFKEIDLKEAGIPEGLNSLIVAGPTESFTDYELFQIDQFLMRGGNLALFLDAFKEVEPPNQQSFAMNQPPRHVPLNTGLEKLLGHYGIRMKKSYVMDENCYKQRLPVQFGGGEREIYFAPIIKDEFINHDVEFMRNIKGLVTMQVSPLELDVERIEKNGLQANRLFSSSEAAWEMRGRIDLNPMLIRPPQSEDELGSFPLAYVVEGEFPSYFAGKPIPEKAQEETDSEKEQAEKANEGKSDVDLSQIHGDGEFLTKGKKGKIFLIGTSQLLKDNMMDEEGRSPNAMFVMNVTDFMNNREDIAVMRSKEQRFNPLHDTGSGARTFIKSFNIAGLPVLVVLFGLLAWFRRSSRKKRIQMMFRS
jgi:ABC-2 type transport system permease protein